ncbi:MAG: spore germination protein GerW family protein [Candidatus Margulisiibacteriota bacterium]|jgi:uncharacterized spore protein YtfJ
MLKDMLQNIIEKLNNSATVKTVFGEPIKAEGKTIIPVAKIGYGFGGGQGTKEAGLNNDNLGMGGGMGVNPIGVIEVTEEETRFISFDIKKKILALFLIFLTLSLIFKRR